MANRQSAHLSDEQLAQFQDGELTPRLAGHLELCSECSRRLQDLRTAEAAYVEYQDSVRAPNMPAPPNAWRTLDALIAQHEAARPRRILRWWPAVALAAAASVALVVLVRQRPEEPSAARVSQLLAQSADVKLPEGRYISMRARGREMMRPAVLILDESEDPEMSRLRATFAAAHYSWIEPLSARSFQSWRRGLREKRDSVSVIEHQGQRRSYRVRTDTPAGVLRSASLTLRSEDLRPTEGAFVFDGDETVEIGETSAPAAPARKPAPAHVEPAEQPASPEDVLRVFAALNEIGTDVGEPIEVTNDAGKVVVRASGLSADRERQVERALKPLARVALDLRANALSTPTSRSTAPERYSACIPAAVRQRLEQRLGGTVALQEITDRVLDASAALLAHAHSVQVLARHFAPEVESGFAERDRTLLKTLRLRHVQQLARLTGQIRMELKPLLATSNRLTRSAGANWQAQASMLADSAGNVDSSLNRLLAGSYSETSGEALLNELTAQIERLESEIRSQQERPQ